MMALHLLQEVVGGPGVSEREVVLTVLAEIDTHHMLQREEGVVGEIQCGQG